jgi:hypothetical protein
MKFEYEITELTTQTELVNAAKAKFTEFKEVLLREKQELKLSKAFSILNAAGQSNVTCSKLFSDLVDSLPKHQAILKLTVSDTLPVDKLAFILDGDSEIDSVTIILR